MQMYAWGCPGLFWAGPGWSGLPCWTFLGCSWLFFWAAVACFELFWPALGYPGLFWAVLGCSELFWVILGCYGLLWAALGCFGLF